MNISKLLHATLLVENLGNARRFYDQVLGFTLSTTRPKMSFEGVWYDLGLHQQLHLMQLPSPETGLQRPLNGGRDRHLAFAVDDLAALMHKLDDASISYTMSLTGRHALFCRDPDDNALEFIALLATE